MLHKHSLRFSFVFLFFILCLCVFIVKLVLLQIFPPERLVKRQSQHFHEIEIEPRRGSILDRQGRPLALNSTVYSLYANPRAMEQDEKEKAVNELIKILPLQADFIRNRLGRDKYFVWIARKLPKDIYKQISALKLSGLGFRKESRRFYPNQELAAHIIGFAGIDNRGLDGLEMKYDRFLKGSKGRSRIMRDAKNRELLIEKDIKEVQHGNNIVLTIDETIQYIAERALDKAFKHFKAKSASIVVMNPKTGEILALANRPTFNLDDLSTYQDTAKPNRAVVYTYEPGSVFKVITAAAALEEGVTQEDEVIHCENGKYRVGNHILKDSHPNGKLTFRQVIEKSSNIGTCKIAQRMGQEKMYEYGKRFRFGQKTGIEMPGEVNGYLKPTRLWSKTSIAAIPMGQEVTVTPLQLVAALSAVANEGMYMKPFIVKAITDYKGDLIEAYESVEVDRVISKETANRVAAILQGVVETGTGKNAQIDGVNVAGKTGTAQKVVDGKYSQNKFYGSFMGFAPTENPQLAIVVTMNETKPYYYGGTVAAPVFKEVMEQSLKYLKTQVGAVQLKGDKDSDETQSINAL